MIVRPPRESELAACGMLLPDAARHGRRREFRLCFDGTLLVGAAAFQDTGIAFSDVQVHVTPDTRRRKIGAYLIGAVAGETAARGRSQLFATVDTVSEPLAAPFLTANGFTRIRCMASFEADFEHACRVLLPLQARVLRRGLPGSARIEELAAPHLREAGLLYADYIARSPELRVEADLLARGLEKLNLSQVLVAGDTVQGVMLAELKDDVATVHARIVTQAWRGSAASALLLGTSLERARPACPRVLRFDTMESTRDTMKLADRLQARVIRSKETFARSA